MLKKLAVSLLLISLGLAGWGDFVLDQTSPTEGGVRAMDDSDSDGTQPPPPDCSLGPRC